MYLLIFCLFFFRVGLFFFFLWDEKWFWVFCVILLLGIVIVVIGDYVYLRLDVNLSENIFILIKILF